MKCWEIIVNDAVFRGNKIIPNIRFGILIKQNNTVYIESRSLGRHSIHKYSGNIKEYLKSLKYPEIEYHFSDESFISDCINSNIIILRTEFELSIEDEAIFHRKFIVEDGKFT